MYYEDLTEYKYEEMKFKWVKYKNIGWLDAEKDYPRGRTSKLFRYCLFVVCVYRVNIMRGCHDCQFCDMERFSNGRNFNFYSWLGSAEIRILGVDGVIYASPNLIYHYVTSHQYKPPSIFIVSTIVSTIVYFPYFLSFYPLFYICRKFLVPILRKKLPYLYQNDNFVKPVSKSGKDVS